MKCPKCQNNSAVLKVSEDKLDVNLECWCGFLQVVQTRRENITITHKVSSDTVTLPSAKSNVRKCLNVLASLEVATSAEVATRLRLLDPDPNTNTSVDRVSSVLLDLVYRKLVEVVENGRHKKGGSTWRLTAEAKQLLGVP